MLECYAGSVAGEVFFLGSERKFNRFNNTMNYAECSTFFSLIVIVSIGVCTFYITGVGDDCDRVIRPCYTRGGSLADFKGRSHEIFFFFFNQIFIILLNAKTLS